MNDTPNRPPALLAEPTAPQNGTARNDPAYRDARDRPVGLWAEHAQMRRRVWLSKLRAYGSMAGVRDRVMLRWIPPQSAILDIGCGGGRPVLSSISNNVTGLEPIHDLAEIARQHYQSVQEVSAQEMPADWSNRFDAAVSTDILGHIGYEHKDAVIKEIFRVLKPGGVTIHVAEVESFSWIAEIARREPEAYQQTWIEEPDHRALEPATKLLQRFEAAGFTIEKAIPMEAWIPAVGGIHGMLRAHTKLPLWLRVARWLDRQLAKVDLVKELATVFISPLGLLNPLAPVNNGLGLVIRARKPPASDGFHKPSCAARI